jgi:RNA polymerase sigma-70 factor (ECF subfamily)
VDDAVQASLVEVLSSIARFESRSRWAVWVTRITVRTTLRLAKKQRSLIPTEALEYLPAAQQAGSRSEAVARTVPEYLQELPEPQRVAVVLRYALDYSVSEIAQATEASPNTVKYRLKEALAKMRRLVHRDRTLWGDRHED